MQNLNNAAFRPSVLVVDDEQELCELGVSLFEREGFRVRAARNGKEAFEMNQAERADVVLTDIRMPGGGGIELLERLKELGPAAPIVIFMSGYSDLSVEEAVRLGAFAIFSKPLNNVKLVAKVRTSLLQSQFEGYLRQIGRNLKAARVKRGLKQKDVETEIGLNYRHYQEIEAGRVNLSLKTMFQLAALFETQMEDLLKKPTE